MPTIPIRQSCRNRAAFSLIEAMVAISIAAVAGSVMLLGVTTSIQTTNEAMERTIAAGIARQLMDEIVGGRYAAKGVDGYQINFGPSAWEQVGSGRQRYDDIDDYHGLQTQPPEDPNGILLGTDDGEGGQRHINLQAPTGFLDDWSEEVDVRYVDESDLSTPLPHGSTSDYRTVEVSVYKDDPEGGRRELAKLKRVVAYVPPM